MNDLILLSGISLLSGIVGFVTGYMSNGDKRDITRLRASCSFLSDRAFTYQEALEEAESRIERALAQVTPGANSTVKRMARMLKGEIA